MNAIEILRSLSEDPNLVDEVLHYLDVGMWDEWDTSFAKGITQFGGQELQLAAKSGLISAEYNAKQAGENA